jgi:hypothetical protein
VYVASNKQLTIFGLLPPGAAKVASQPSQNVALQPSPIATPTQNSPHRISGKLLAVNGSTLTLQTRNGKSVKIEASQAIQNEEVESMIVGEAYTALASSLTAVGALQATTIVRAKGFSGKLWDPDD